MSAFDFLVGEWLLINDQTSTNVIIDSNGNVIEEPNVVVGTIEIVSPTKINLTIDADTTLLNKVGGAWTNPSAKLRMQRR